MPIKKSNLMEKIFFIILNKLKYIIFNIHFSRYNNNKIIYIE